MPALVAGIRASFFLSKIKDVDGRDIRAFTPIFDGLCPAMTTRVDRSPATGLNLQHWGRSPFKAIH
jgi:hypothetical protein